MRTFFVRTFGCQMNKHDSERVTGLLLDMGLEPAADPTAADVIVFLTCCVRENAEDRLRGHVTALGALKRGRDDRGPLIAVGGCIGQRDGAMLLETLPQVDVVFGTHNVHELPELLIAASDGTPRADIHASGDTFTSDLPARREHRWHAWVPITVGCDNFCSYCIVPYVRGRERSRPLDAIVTEVEGLVADGVREVTLLGQNVNSYGRDLFGEPRFHEVLRRVARTGVDRVRFATSHPKDLSEATIEVMATEPAVMPALHLPVQSGSDAVLARMNRGYTAAEYLSLVARVYERIPGLALSTDVIVGFPGETEADFEATLALFERARFDQAFTFIFSPRPGTPAASMPDRVPTAVARARFERLVELVKASALEKNRSLVGTEQHVLFEGPSKRDPDILTGRTPGNKVVHVKTASADEVARHAGRIGVVRITEARTWFVTGELMGTTV